MKKLVDEIEQFMYTHPIQHYKKELLDMIRKAEDMYIKKIAELEQANALSEFDRMINEGGSDSEIEESDNNEEEFPYTRFNHD